MKTFGSLKESSDGVVRWKLCSFATPVVEGRAWEIGCESEVALRGGRIMESVKERKRAELRMARAKKERALCWSREFCTVNKHGFFVVKLMFGN